MIGCHVLPLQVTVALVDLSPEFNYTSVPRLSPHSFLQAKAKNTSNYAMLAGPSNIFLDNNFIAKVQPLQQLCCAFLRFETLFNWYRYMYLIPFSLHHNFAPFSLILGMFPPTRSSPLHWAWTRVSASRVNPLPPSITLEVADWAGPRPAP